MTNTNRESPEQRGLTVVETDPEPTEQGRSLIVAIGINNYIHWQKLTNAVQDATGLQQTLIDKLGFTALVPPLLDEAATKTAIISLIEDQLREELQENDNLVLFFAGHGHTRIDKVGGKTVGETGFIIPVEGRGPKEVWSDYIQIDPFLQSISRLPAKHILVILDSCHSGFALGEAMRSFRDAVRYEKDLSSRISRKVITSARREQLALDSGPIPGHSLFTGTLVDGFNWGKADLDGNGLITSSELGLFIQQQVGQASKSEQTPDFGSFYLDDRGEMVISLRDQSFDSLKARAFSAFYHGEISDFRELTQQIVGLKPGSPEALYLEYRLRLFECNVKQASAAIQKLFELHPPAGRIPLSQNDLETLSSYLNIPKWAYEFTISEVNFPLEVTLLSGSEPNDSEIAQKQLIGELKGFCLKNKQWVRFKVKNLTNEPIYLYLIAVDSAGRIEPTPIWQNDSIDWYGLEPEGEELSYSFRVTKDAESIGMNEFRFFSSPQRINQLLRAPTPDSRYGLQGLQNLQNFNLGDLEKIRTKVVYYKEV